MTHLLPVEHNLLPVGVGLGGLVILHELVIHELGVLGVLGGVERWLVGSCCGRCLVVKYHL